MADDLELEFETPGRGLSGGKGRGTPPDQGVQDPDSAITVQVAPDRGAVWAVRKAKRRRVISESPDLLLFGKCYDRMIDRRAPECGEAVERPAPVCHGHAQTR